MIFFKLLLLMGLSWSKENRVLTFSNEVIGVCGKHISWGSAIPSLTPREVECLNSLSPWIINWDDNLNNGFKNNESSKVSNSQVDSPEFISVFQRSLISLLRMGRNECLEKVEIKIPHKIQIKTTKKLSVEYLKNWIQKEIKNNLGSRMVELNNVNLPKVDCTQVNKLNWSAFKVEGKNQFRFMLYVDDNNYGVTGDFRVYENVPVFIRPKRTSEKIVEEDLGWQRKDITFSNGIVLKSDELIGRTLKQSVSIGQVIEARYLKEESLIEKGQLIQVQYVGNDFILSAQAQAEQSGTKGDLIRIKNLETNKLFSATILEKGIVEVK